MKSRQSPVEIRSPRADEREALLDLLEGAFDKRTEFALYIDADPAFRWEDFLVAFDGPRPVSCVQVFEKRVCGGDTAFRLGGIGSVATDRGFRGRGLASELMRRQVLAMEKRGCALGLLFTGRTSFYERLGWVQCPLPQVAVQRPAMLAEGPATLRPFQPSDLLRVKALYGRYSGNLVGTTVRDDAYWAGQLRYAGAPDERFWVAEMDGDVVAYARTVELGLVCAMEHARDAAAAESLAQLLVALAPGRGALVLRTPPDPELRDALGARAAAVHDLPDPTPMWRVLDRTRVSLAPLAPRVDDRDARSDADWIRVLVSRHSLHYWLSDRF